MLAFYFACAGVGFLVMFLYAFDDELYIRLLAACVFAVPSLAGTMYFCTWMVSLDRKCPAQLGVQQLLSRAGEPHSLHRLGRI